MELPCKGKKYYIDAQLFYIGINDQIMFLLLKGHRCTDMRTWMGACSNVVEKPMAFSWV